MFTELQMYMSDSQISDYLVFYVNNWIKINSSDFSKLDLNNQLKVVKESLIENVELGEYIRNVDSIVNLICTSLNQKIG